MHVCFFVMYHLLITRLSVFFSDLAVLNFASKLEADRSTKKPFRPRIRTSSAVSVN